MKKKIVIFMMLSCLGIASVGCSNNNVEENSNTENSTRTSSTENTTQPISDVENSSDNEGADVLDNADLFGTVIDFSETGCTLGKGSDSDDTKMTMANGASADDVSQISVIYGENTEYQIALTSATDITLESGSKEDVKKSSVIYIYGTNREDGTFLADKVIVERYQE